MGFYDALVQRALVEAGGNEQAAIEMLIDGLYPDATAPPKKFNSRKTPEIFSMGFDERLVRDALVSVGGDEQQALEMLLCKSASLSSSGALFAGGASASNPLAAAASKPPKQTNKKGSKPPTRRPSTLFVDRSVFMRLRGPLRQLHEAMLRGRLVCTALCVQAKRSLQPMPPFPPYLHLLQPMPPFPPYLHLQFLPLQLQRFLRGFVLSIAHRLITPVVFHFVRRRTKSRWINRIVMRVMSAFVAGRLNPNQVRPQGVCFIVLCCSGALIFGKRSHDLTIISLMHGAAITCRHAGRHAGTSTCRRCSQTL